MRSEIFLILATSVAVFGALGLVPEDDRSFEFAAVTTREPPPAKVGPEFQSGLSDTDARIERLDREVQQLTEKVNQLAQALHFLQASLEARDNMRAVEPALARHEAGSEESFNTAD